MQKEIDCFNRAFVRLATAYAGRVYHRAQEEEPTAPGAAQQFRLELMDEARTANVLAVTVGRMWAASGGGFNEPPEEGKEPPQDAPDAEPVTLGPGTYFHMEDTSASGQKGAAEGMTLETMIKKIVREVITALQGIEAVHIKATPENESELERIAQEMFSTPDRIVNLPPDTAAGKDTAQAADSKQNAPGGAWELLRDILTGKQPIPQGAVFNVTIDTGGSPQAVKMKTEPDAPQDAADTQQEGN